MPYQDGEPRLYAVELNIDLPQTMTFPEFSADGDFVVEFEFKFLSGTSFIFSYSPTSAGRFECYITNSNVLHFYLSHSFFLNSGVALVVDTLYRVKIERISGATTLHLNDELKDSVTSTATIKIDGIQNRPGWSGTQPTIQLYYLKLENHLTSDIRYYEMNEGVDYDVIDSVGGGSASLNYFSNPNSHWIEVVDGWQYDNRPPYVPPALVVTGTVKIDSLPAARTVKAFSYAALTFDIDATEVTLSMPLGESVSSADTGEYTITLDITYTDQIFVVAFDNYGAIFESEASIAVGAIIHPSTPNGLVYKCTSAGQLPIDEPDTWPEDTGQIALVGTAAFQPTIFYQPVCHGPLMPMVSG